MAVTSRIELMTAVRPNFHQPALFAEDIRMRGFGHDLSGDGGEDASCLRAVERRTHRQLHQPVGAVGDAVAPAFTRVVTTVVTHLCEVACGPFDHRRAFGFFHPRCAAVAAGNFGQHQRSEGRGEAIGVIGIELRVAALAQRTQAGGVELAAAHPRGQCGQRGVVAHGGVG